ncbi:serine hydrolase [Tenacibaculum sp.]|uniref:serine hydrolase n=1 Tax=Tenacibaculum sp. TaxID=1906242 RepID=UPI003D13512E
MIKNFKTFLALTCLFSSISCVNPENKKNTDEAKQKIDNYLSKTIKLHNIPGLALAVVEGDNIVYENYFGKASLEDDIPVDKNTLFRIFSATKLITSTAVFQLIQDKKLDLKDPISKYLENLPPQWQRVKIENLLSHSSGIPDLIRYESNLSDKELMEKLAKDNMEFITGNQFKYNQTNYWLLAQIIEKITQKPFDEYVLKKQFDGKTKGVLFSSNSLELIPNRAIRYFYNNKTKTFEKDKNNSGKRGFSGNGLNITLDEFIKWNKLLDDNKLLKEQAKSKMWFPFHFTNKKDRFLHGWNSYYVNGVSSYGFSGGNLAAFRKFTDSNTTIILLSNGYEIPAYDIIVNDIARIVIPNLSNKKLTFEEDIMRSILNKEYLKATTAFKKLNAENQKTDFENLKWNINTIGNSLTYSNNLHQAQQVFKINAEANPNWWVSLASLAESYEMQNDTLKAIDNYKKSIALNENNEWNYNEEMTKKIVQLSHK